MAFYAGRFDFKTAIVRNWFRFETLEEAKETMLAKEKAWMAKYGQNESTVEFIWDKDADKSIFLQTSDFQFYPVDQVKVTSKQVPLASLKHITCYKTADRWIKDRIKIDLISDPKRKSLSGK